MEAVPRMPMLCFTLKQSPEYVEFGPVLKKYIRDHYGEDPATYNKACIDLEQLRQNAVRVPRDFTGCSTLKKYFSQLQFLQTRFPLGPEDESSIPFTWEDFHTGREYTYKDVKFEQASILYNVGALHSILGAADMRNTAEGMKVSCTHFQCASWAFEYLRDHFTIYSQDMSREMMSFHVSLMLAQAQECILEKSMSDSRKSTITAKVAAEIVEYYKHALKNFTIGYDQGILSTSLFKAWKRRMEMKSLFHQCIKYFYMGQQSEDQQKWGERVTYFTSAHEILAECLKLAKDEDDEVHEPLQFIFDVVEGKYTSAKKDNDFIYHEKVPALESLPEVKGASLVKGIAFNPNDPDISGPDIFKKLVPLQAHEASSLYSEEKAKLSRKVGGQIEEKNQELTHFISSLQVDQSKLNPEQERLPQSLLERCAAISVRPNAIKDLVDSMAAVSGVATDVNLGIKEINDLLEDNAKRDEEFEKTFGKRTPCTVLAEIKKECDMYEEGHKRGSQSNVDLHKAMNAHITNLKLLSGPLEDIQKALPTLDLTKNPENETIVKELQKLLSKVDEMKNQRDMLEDQFRTQIREDDITTVLVMQENVNTEVVFQEHLKKHDKFISLIQQNLLAQDNILRALTDANAKYAAIRKITNEVSLRREAMLKDLMTSYDVYEDLLAKSQKGIEFYKKLETNVSQLVQRCHIVCKSKEEEREQIKTKYAPKVQPPSRPAAPKPVINALPSFEGPKLKDYLPFMKPATFGKNAIRAPSSQPDQVMPAGSLAAHCNAVDSQVYPHQALSSAAQSNIGMVSSSQAGSQPPDIIQYIDGSASHQGPASNLQKPHLNQISTNTVSAVATPIASPAMDGQSYTQCQQPVVTQAGKKLSLGGTMHHIAQALPNVSQMHNVIPGGFTQPGSIDPHSASKQQAPHTSSIGYASPSLALTSVGELTNVLTRNDTKPGQQQVAGGQESMPQTQNVAASQSFVVSQSHGGLSYQQQIPSSSHLPIHAFQQPTSGSVMSTPPIRNQDPMHLQPGQLPASQHLYEASGVSQSWPNMHYCQPQHSVYQQPARSGYTQNSPIYSSSQPQLIGNYNQSQPTGMPQQINTSCFQTGQQQAMTSQGRHYIQGHQPSQQNYSMLEANAAAVQQFQQPNHKQQLQYEQQKDGGTCALPQQSLAGALSQGFLPQQGLPQQSPQKLQQVPSLPQKPSSHTNAMIPVPFVQNRSNLVQENVHSQTSFQQFGLKTQTSVYSQPQHPVPTQQQMSAQFQQQILPRSTQQSIHPGFQQVIPACPQQPLASSQLPTIHQRPQQSVPPQQQQAVPQQQILRPPPPPQQQQAVPQQQILRPPPPPQQQQAVPQQQILRPPPPPQQQQAVPQQQILHRPPPPQQQQAVPQQQILHRPPPPQQQQAVPQQQILHPPQQQAAVPQQQILHPPQQQAAVPQQQILCPPPQQQAAVPQQQILCPPPQQQQAVPQQQILHPLPPQQQQAMPQKPIPSQQKQAMPPRSQQPIPSQPQQPIALSQAQPISPQHQLPVAPQAQQPVTSQSNPRHSHLSSTQHHLELSPHHLSLLPNQLHSTTQSENQPHHIPSTVCHEYTTARQPASNVSQPHLDPSKLHRQWSTSTTSSLDDILSSSPENSRETVISDIVLTPKVMTPQEIQQQKEEALKNSSIKQASRDPYEHEHVLKKFVSEVKKYEKMVDGLCKPTLNGPSPLDSIWKDLCDEQEKDGRKHSMAAARCDAMKNRDPDTMPYDNTRVLLTGQKDDYINASWLDDLAASCPKFIATQAPLNVTVVDFWIMVYEQGAEVIVMLFSEAEAGKKFPCYWPAEKGQTIHHGPISLTLQSQKDKQMWVESLIYLTHTETKQARTIVHLQYKNWPISGFPEKISYILQFITEVHSFYRQQRSLTKPVIVHCSNGVGRTGTFILTYTGVQEVNRANGFIDIPCVAKKMMQKRRNVIRDKEQLKFCYDAILYHAEDLLIKRGILTNKASFGDKLPVPGDKTHQKKPSGDFILGMTSLAVLQSHLTKDSGRSLQAVELTNPPDASTLCSSLPDVVQHKSVDGNGKVTPETRSRSGSGSSSKSGSGGASLTGSPQHKSSHFNTKNLPPSLAELQNPNTFTLDSGSSKKKITKSSFTHKTSSITDSLNNPDDPLSSLDPLWTMNKNKDL